MQISLRACPVVSSPDGTPRHRAQASWPDVVSPSEVARGIGAAMALPTGTATARSHGPELACDAVWNPYPVGTAYACEDPLYRGCTARGLDNPPCSHAVKSCYAYGCSSGAYLRRNVNYKGMTANNQYNNNFVFEATFPRRYSDDKFYSDTNFHSLD